MRRARSQSRLIGWALPLAIACAAGAFVLLRASWTSTPDGDPALHLRLIQDIAATRSLPSELPNTPARIEAGGEITAMFPYSYPPLYHALGAVAYEAAGLAGVLGLNALAAAAISLALFAFLSRRLATIAAAAIALAWLAAPPILGPFRSPYMEPIMMAFVFAGAWYSYLALATRRFSFAIFAGILLGLALATRQNALFAVLGIGLVLAVGLVERGAWRPSRIKREAGWLAAFAVAGAMTAGPALLFLAIRSGGIGYADNWLPGTGSALAIDPAANDYIASITKPDASPMVWLDRYRSTLIYTESWSAEWLSMFVVAAAMAGVAFLHARPGGSRFLARWIVAQIVIDAGILMTLHGNPRYVIVSQVLFHTAVAVGVYYVLASGVHFVRRDPGVVRFAAAAAGAAVLVAVAFGLAPRGSEDINRYLRTGDRDLRNFRGSEYAEMGAWVNANTRDDALILTPRAYTALLTWERNVTWVTFYGNAWVIDAISANDPQRANEILNEFGVDYVLVTDPPGTYIDAMPADGMRSFLQLNKPHTAYFELVHTTSSDGEFSLGGRTVEHGLRLYEVKQGEEVSHAPR